jgi:hypothetical protein
MAKHNVIYGCGHEGEISLYGPQAERERRIEWFRKHSPCRDCGMAERDKLPPSAYARLVPGKGVELYVATSYHVRAILKELGYRFLRVTLPSSPLGVEITATGVRRTDVGAWAKVHRESGTLRSDAEWMRSMGWDVRAIDADTALMQSLGEGRPDLLPPSPESAGGGAE